MSSNSSPPDDGKIPCTEPGCKSRFVGTSPRNRHIRGKHSADGPKNRNGEPAKAKAPPRRDLKWPCTATTCDKKFGSKTGSDQHVAKMHGAKGKAPTARPCPLAGCPGVFATDRGVQDHLKLHDNPESQVAKTYLEVLRSKRAGGAATAGSAPVAREVLLVWECEECPQKFFALEAFAIHAVQAHGCDVLGDDGQLYQSPVSSTPCMKPSKSDRAQSQRLGPFASSSSVPSERGSTSSTSVRVSSSTSVPTSRAANRRNGLVGFDK